MSTSSRFAVGVHLLAAIASQEGRPVNSVTLARSANTNAAVARRLLSMLSRAGLVKSRLGAGGGAFLAKTPAEITLLEVYHALEVTPLFQTHHCEPSESCPIGYRILSALAPVTRAAEDALEAVLAQSSIADITGFIHDAETIPATKAIFMGEEACAARSFSQSLPMINSGVSVAPAPACCCSPELIEEGWEDYSGEVKSFRSDD